MEGLLIILLYLFAIGFVLYVLWNVLETLRSIDRSMAEIARNLHNQP